MGAGKLAQQLRVRVALARAQVQFPGPIEQLATSYNTGSGEPNFYPLLISLNTVVHMHTHTGKTLTHIK